MTSTAATHLTWRCHLVAVPYPGRGHINPMMNLCKLLANLQSDLLITFVITEEWLGLIGAEEKPQSIQFATIPNVLPSEKERGANMISFLEATQTKMGEPFEQLINRLDVPVNFIIADTFLNWAIEVGNRRNIPVASLWTMPASVFSIFYHFDLLEKNCDYPFELSGEWYVERGEERVNYIPGIPSIRLVDIPSVAYMKDQRLLRLALLTFCNVHKAQYLLFTSISELEQKTIDALKQDLSIPIYTIGPSIPYFKLENANDHHHYFEWLNSQPPSSVLYVSLGSFLSVSSDQMDEIADGLRESGVRFLWVARGEADRLQEKCGQVGKIVPWCEQLKVMCHSSIGGFWTHCGWNSTMEGIYSGVSMIALPLMLDQTTIRKHIVEDWRIGVDVGRDMGGGLLRRGKIAKFVKKFMDLESNERKEMGRRANELQKVTQRAISGGVGSSKKNITSFLEHIIASAE